MFLIVVGLDVSLLAADSDVQPPDVTLGGSNSNAVSELDATERVEVVSAAVPAPVTAPPAKS